MTPAELGRFIDHLHVAAPAAEVCIDRPGDPAGEWWIDVTCDGFRTSLSWQKALGFGVYTDDEAAFGTRPDEIYRRSELAAQRVGILCEQFRAHHSVGPLWLAEVRKLTGTPQTVLAASLDRNQPAVSRLKTREDMKLSTLATYLEAMGGRLEMRVHFKDWDATIALPEQVAKQGA